MTRSAVAASSSGSRIGSQRARLPHDSRQQAFVRLGVLRRCRSSFRQDAAVGPSLVNPQEALGRRPQGPLRCPAAPESRLIKRSPRSTLESQLTDFPISPARTAWDLSRHRRRRLTRLPMEGSPRTSATSKAPLVRAGESGITTNIPQAIRPETGRPPGLAASDRSGRVHEHGRAEAYLTPARHGLAQGSSPVTPSQCHQTSPGRHPQLMGAVRSRGGEDGVGRMRM